MQKAEAVALFPRQAFKVRACRLEQRIGSNNVGLDEGVGPGDRAIDMALRSQVHHGIRLVLAKHRVDRHTVGNVGLDERVARVLRDLGQRIQVRRIGQLVDDDDGWHRSRR